MSGSSLCRRDTAVKALPELGARVSTTPSERGQRDGKSVKQTHSSCCLGTCDQRLAALRNSSKGQRKHEAFRIYGQTGLASAHSDEGRGLLQQREEQTNIVQGGLKGCLKFTPHREGSDRHYRTSNCSDCPQQLSSKYLPGRPPAICQKGPPKF